MEREKNLTYSDCVHLVENVLVSAPSRQVSDKSSSKARPGIEVRQ
jgi:hypothetical protein